MKNKSLISRLTTVGALVLLPVMHMSAAASPMKPATMIKLGAAILLANFLLTTILSFFVLKKINKAWWTPSIVVVTMLSHMLGSRIVVASFGMSATTSYIMLLLGTTLIPFFIQAVVWYIAFGKRNPRTVLLLTGVSAIYPITLLLLQIFYWITGVGY